MMRRIRSAVGPGLILVCLIAMCRQGYAQVTVSQTPIPVEMSEEYIHVQKVLNGRACRAATDQDWQQVCRLAVTMSDHLDEAKKPKPEPKKDP